MIVKKRCLRLLLSSRWCQVESATLNFYSSRRFCLLFVQSFEWLFFTRKVNLTSFCDKSKESFEKSFVRQQEPLPVSSLFQWLVSQVKPHFIDRQDESQDRGDTLLWVKQPEDRLCSSSHLFTTSFTVLSLTCLWHLSIWQPYCHTVNYQIFSRLQVVVWSSSLFAQTSHSRPFCPYSVQMSMTKMG